MHPKVTQTQAENLRQASRNLAWISVKWLKLVKIILISFFLSACAAGGKAAQNADLFEELRAENTRLEERLTDLREQNLRKERKSPSCPVLAAEVPVDQAPSLPLVKMGPEPEEEEEVEPNFSSVSASSISAHSQPETPIKSNIRPVLKVRGEHEAWVYNRPLKASELGDEKTSSMRASTP